MPADPQPSPSPLSQPVLADQGPHESQGLEFGRNELSGAFGDIGTDLPLLAGMILASGLDASWILVVFGAMQVATGLLYRIPMPVQPLKAVAVIVIAQSVPPGVIRGGGIAIGALMLLLVATGTLQWIARVVPHAVVRGLQLGLGAQLLVLAATRYIPALGRPGYMLAGACALVVLALLGNRRVPPAPFVIALGLAFALLGPGNPDAADQVAVVASHRFTLPTLRDMATGFILLALPQVPLSLGNSVLATDQLTRDLFPRRRPPGVRRIGTTYGVMNVVAALIGGIPVCHGSGGLAGHYALGGRTGGSVVVYGGMLVAAGLLLGASFQDVTRYLPLPMLGVLLVVEAVTLARLARDLPRGMLTGLPTALFVAALIVTVPYGYAVGIVAGTLLHVLLRSVERRRAA